MSEAFTVQLGHEQSPWFRVETGRVLEESKRTETSVHHSSSVRTDGFASSSSSSSSTIHNRTHSVWIEKDDGLEMEVELPSHDFSVRAGHRISVAWGGKGGSAQGPFVAAVNHSTGTTWTVDGASLKPVVNFDTSIWGWVAIVSVAIAALCWKGGGGAAIGLGMMMGPAEFLAWFIVNLAKIPEQIRQHNAVVGAVGRLVSNMKLLDGRMTSETLVQTMRAP